jgi:hypothetical protein
LSENMHRTYVVKPFQMLYAACIFDLSELLLGISVGISGSH